MCRCWPASPGAAERGALKDRVLPRATERIRRRLAGCGHGDRWMVAILSAVLTDGLLAVEAACAEAIGEGVHSADVTLNILGTAPGASAVDHHRHPEALRLRHEPVADCARYDRRRSTV